LNVATSGHFDNSGNCDAVTGAGGIWNVKGNVLPKIRSNHNSSIYPVNNSYPEDFSGIGMQGYRRCDPSADTDPCNMMATDFSLRPDSIFKNTATDNTDPGIDVVKLNERTRCTVGGDTRTCIVGAVSPAFAQVGGRVTNAFGRGLYGTRITITGVGVRQTVIANPFGYYAFTDILVGETYNITANNKRFEFSNGTQSLLVNDDLVDVNFIAQ